MLQHWPRWRSKVTRLIKPRPNFPAWTIYNQGICRVFGLFLEVIGPFFAMLTSPLSSLGSNVTSPWPHHLEGPSAFLSLPTITYLVVIVCYHLANYWWSTLPHLNVISMRAGPLPVLVTVLCPVPRIASSSRRHGANMLNTQWMRLIGFVWNTLLWTLADVWVSVITYKMLNGLKAGVQTLIRKSSPSSFVPGCPPAWTSKVHLSEDLSFLAVTYIRLHTIVA